nr:hypothetical protein Iba_chr08eCG0710 [Ipomoea batatas]
MMRLLFATIVNNSILRWRNELTSAAGSGGDMERRLRDFRPFQRLENAILGVPTNHRRRILSIPMELRPTESSTRSPPDSATPSEAAGQARDRKPPTGSRDPAEIRPSDHRRKLTPAPATARP